MTCYKIFFIYLEPHIQMDDFEPKPLQKVSHHSNRNPGKPSTSTVPKFADDYEQGEYSGGIHHAVFREIGSSDDEDDFISIRK